MTMRKIQLTANRSKSNSAWTKAPADVAVIAERMGFEAYDIDRGLIERASLAGRVLNKLGLLTWANRCVFRRRLGELRKMFKCAGGGELLIQHPVPNMVSAEISRIDELAGLKTVGVKIIVLVHDIGALRGKSEDVGGVQDDGKERAVLAVADRLIVHNARMKSWLIEAGYAAGIIVELGLFDYLIPDDVSCTCREIGKKYSVAVAGNLGGGKAGYVESLKTITGIDWRLYGSNYDEARHCGPGVEYRGSFPPEELPMVLDANFGLVWDGSCIDTCAGETGEYLKFNNPHKFSLYIACGLPVVVWSKAAVADLVKEKNLGVTVDDLRTLPEVLRRVDATDYRLMKRSVQELSVMVRRGDYCSAALQLAQLQFF